MKYVRLTGEAHVRGQHLWRRLRLYCDVRGVQQTVTDLRAFPRHLAARHRREGINV